jgi:hypothetical protein
VTTDTRHTLFTFKSFTDRNLRHLERPRSGPRGRLDNVNNLKSVYVFGKERAEW